MSNKNVDVTSRKLLRLESFAPVTDTRSHKLPTSRSVDYTNVDKVTRYGIDIDDFIKMRGKIGKTGEKV